MNESLMRWALLALGWTYLVTEAAITTTIRVPAARAGGPFVQTLLYCAACTGFWVGCTLGAFHMWPWSDTLWAIPESGFAAMALGATWASWRGGNPTYLVEAEYLHDEETTREARETDHAE